MTFTCVLLFFSSCKNDIEPNKTYPNIKVSQKTLKELSDYINYTFTWYSSTYSSYSEEFDLNHFNIHLKKFKFSATNQTRSTEDEGIDVIAESIPYYKNILSSEGYDLISHIIENKEYLSLSDLTIAISNLNHKDQKILAPVMTITKAFYDSLNNNLVATRGVRNPTACNVITSIASTITGSIWGAVFGGQHLVVLLAMRLGLHGASQELLPLKKNV